MALDERLRTELERAARPADPSGLYEHLIRRRERRRIVRKVQTGLLTVAVITGSIAGVYILSLVFREGASPPKPAASTPSNGAIVFTRDITGEGVHLFASSADGSDVRRLTPDGRAVYRSPDMSPDGRTVVVAHEIPSFEPGQAVLATVPIEGGSPTWLTEETWLVLDPTWSPDGGRIAFAGSPGGPFGIYVFDLETGDVRLVPGTDGISVGHPTWSPDGTRIAFEGSTASDTDPAQTWDIYAVAVDGSGMTTNLTNTPDVGEIQPAWSWTVDRIAFVEAGPAEGALRTMSSTGADALTVFSGELGPANPVWSPDGTAIAFEGGSEGIFTVASDGAGPFVVPDIQGANPTWQPLPQGDEISPQPSPTPTPTESPAPEGAEDIGLGYVVCDVTSVRGSFLPGDGTQTALVGTDPLNGGCGRLADDAAGVVGLDVDGDGFIDVAVPLECQQFCSAFAAPDVDGDGTDELLVQNIQFSVAGLRLFDLVSIEDEPALVAVTVEPPGDAVLGFQGFDGSGLPQFWIGGDGFGVDALRCEQAGGGRVLVSTTAQMVPPDSADSVWEAHETTFVLEEGVLHVIGARDFEEPTEFGPGARPSFTGTGGCGADLDPFD